MKEPNDKASHAEDLLREMREFVAERKATFNERRHRLSAITRMGIPESTIRNWLSRNHPLTAHMDGGEGWRLFSDHDLIFLLCGYTLSQHGIPGERCAEITLKAVEFVEKLVTEVHNFSVPKLFVWNDAGDWFSGLSGSPESLLGDLRLGAYLTIDLSRLMEIAAAASDQSVKRMKGKVSSDE